MQTCVHRNSAATVFFDLYVNSSQIKNVLKLRILPEGLLKTWNDAHPSLRIVPGDRILAIGGATSGAEDR